MKNTLIDLWNGTLALNGHSIHGEETQKLVGYLDKHHSKLCELLSQSDQETLQKYADCYDELLVLECENAFVQGFSLAAKIFTEALT